MWTTLGLVMWVVAVSGYWVMVGIWIYRNCADEYVSKAEDAFYSHRADAQKQREIDTDPCVLRRLDHRQQNPWT